MHGCHDFSRKINASFSEKNEAAQYLDPFGGDKNQVDRLDHVPSGDLDR